ncbi:N-acetylmuramoyl-L-alanine amidase [Dactylosporangium sp. AC04546]|uniref:N-acetylmuramoyl-L-alanine amidase n=1 Tax=Dactylosporangium sp. AC04546 TaxID=2862460 RepID=UPI001EDFB289|nr:N-acetylmuramoyl-L-alanine amidase [Dactylosporangium sp. AC04546]WVK83003.1 N-acetylmuramoyl-L-alanine amidase [Dactylosporangium sp. AC04546]
MQFRATRRYRRHKLVAVVACTLSLFGAGTGGATADPRSLPVAPPDLAEPLAWANPAAREPGGAGVTPQVTRIALGDFHRPAAGTVAQGGTLSDVPLAEGYRRTRQTRTLTTTRATTGRFSAVGVTWRETTGVGEISVAVRHHVPGGAWSNWRAVTAAENDRDPAQGPVQDLARPEAAAGAQRGGADLLWVGPSDGVQVSVTSVSGTAPHDVTADLIDPTDAPGDAVPPPPPPAEAAPVGLRPFMPAINRRAAWGADERQMDWRPQYAPYVKAVAVHHTATPNGYSESDVPKILRSIYQFQTVSRGWGDIGYNVLVDRFGRLWEGRSGGLARPVVGAQAGGFNTGTAGIAIIGDYRTTTVPPAVVEATSTYVAWKLSLSRAIDPRGTVTLTGGGSTSRYPVGTSVTVPRVFPHRQTNPTECPGDKGMEVLPRIRDRAGELLGELVEPGVVRTLMAAYRPADGTVWLQGQPQPVFTTGPNEIAVPADYNGDGRVDVATWSPTTGNWTMLLSGLGRRVVQWGLPGDVPVPADFDGDGKAELTVYRPSTGDWYIKGIGQIRFGAPGDQPVPGDYTGDGRAEAAIWRPATKTWAIYALREFTLDAESGAVAVPADYDGNGTLDPATWSPTTQQFTVEGKAPVRLGDPGDTPIPGQYDGDGRADLAVFHDGWFEIHGVGSYDVGSPGDIPMPLG